MGRTPAAEDRATHPPGRPKTDSRGTWPERRPGARPRFPLPSPLARGRPRRLPENFRALLTLAAGADGLASPGSSRVSAGGTCQPGGPGRRNAPRCTGASSGAAAWRSRCPGLRPRRRRGWERRAAPGWWPWSAGLRAQFQPAGPLRRRHPRLRALRHQPGADPGRGPCPHYPCLLGLQRHVPPLALARGGSGRAVGSGRRSFAAHWTEGSVVSLTRWLPNLTDVVPAPWRSEDGPSAAPARRRR